MPKIKKEVYHLRLYVADQTPKSQLALGNLREICEEHLKDRCEIEVIDLVKNPRLAKADHIVAVPTLVRKFPPTSRRIIGDLSNTSQVVAGLELQSGNKKNSHTTPHTRN